MTAAVQRRSPALVFAKMITNWSAMVHQCRRALHPHRRRQFSPLRQILCRNASAYPPIHACPLPANCCCGGPGSWRSLQRKIHGVGFGITGTRDMLARTNFWNVANGALASSPATSLARSVHSKCGCAVLRRPRNTRTTRKQPASFRAFRVFRGQPFSPSCHFAEGTI